MLIEGLMALLLITLLLSMVAVLQLNVSQQADALRLQAIALQQMANMLAEYQVDQGNIIQWNQKNRERLPQGKAFWFDKVLVIQWRSVQSVWNCSMPPVKHNSCYAVRLT